MKLIDLWKLNDCPPAPMFIRFGTRSIEILDGPGYPVVNGRNASNMEISRVAPAQYSMRGNVLVVTMATGKMCFPNYGLLEYLDPKEYHKSDEWQYEGTAEGMFGFDWDIVSRKGAPFYDCRYTHI